MWKSQFWLLANVANVQETTSLKGLVKMSRDHSLAWAPSSTATCISPKTYIWPLGMIRSWAHSFWATFCVFVCVRASVSARVPLAVRDILCLSPRLLSASSATLRPRWRPSGAFSRVCVCVPVCHSWMGSCHSSCGYIFMRCRRFKKLLKLRKGTLNKTLWNPW